MPLFALISLSVHPSRARRLRSKAPSVGLLDGTNVPSGSTFRLGCLGAAERHIRVRTHYRQWVRALQVDGAPPEQILPAPPPASGRRDARALPRETGRR